MTAIRLLLSLMLLTGLAACGPAPSDEASNVGATASVAGQEGGREARGTGREGGSSEAVAPLASSLSPRAPSLVIPDWMATELASPDAQVRLKAVETWGWTAPRGSVDPLIHALEDQDELVQARALALIVQDWAREQAAQN